MNVSMQDGFNLGWKLASVLLGRCCPDILHTCSDERQSIADELIGVVVRPDQHVAHVLPLEAHADLAAFFGGFMMSGPVLQDQK